jgi:steroid delta-isomerase-like uncharacterized protein
MKSNKVTIGTATVAILCVCAALAHTRLVSANLRTSVPVSATADAAAPVHTAHEYTPYEKLILQNVSQFHKNFNARNFAKNGDLVADNLHVDSNGTEVNGRDAFVSRIGRFVTPFPDVKIDDQIVVVDGNTAAIRFVITGMQKGDLQTPEGLIPATNRFIHVDGAEFFTFDKEGKLTDLVTVENLTRLFQQLKTQN